MEIAMCIKGVSTAAKQYHNNSSSSNMSYLKHQLEVLQTVSARSESLKCLSPTEMATFECLACLTEILGNTNCKPPLMELCLHILSNLAKDCGLCKLIQDSFNFDHVLATTLKTHGGSPDDPLTQMCLQLLQRLTYGRRISFHESFVDDLLKFLIKQVLSPHTAITQSCLGVLANLCHDNFPIQARIKSMDNVQKLYKALCKFFPEEDLTAAVFALSLFTSLCLTEELGDKVFNSQNIKQVLQLVFNVLVNGEPVMARSYAVDLLQELLHNPRLQKAIEEYKNLPKCIEDTLKLISSSSASSVAKVFELLTSFCSLGSLRGCMCRLLFSAAAPPAEQLSGMLGHPPRTDCPPLIAAVCWAALGSHHSNQAAVAALNFLKEMYEEVLCTEDQSLQSGVSLVLPVMVQILKEPLNPEAPHLKDVCHRLCAALRLLTVLCGEDEMKASVAERVKTQDLVQALQFQLTHNRVANTHTSAFRATDAAAQDWGSVGVEMVLLILQLMSKVRRYVPGLEDAFITLLQDNRVVPFLARGWTSRDRDLVQISLHLTCLGSSLENFPDVILGDAVAAANACMVSQSPASSDAAMDLSQSLPLVRSDNKENLPLNPRCAGDLSLQTSVYQVQDDSIQSLIERMQSSTELKDFKTADVIEIYEHRLTSHQTKEDHLQDLLEAKSLALTQADRLIAQYRSRQARHGAEAHKMRCLFQEAEKKNEGLLQEMNELRLEKDRLRNDYDLLRHEKNQLAVKALELEELKATYSDLSDKCDELESALMRKDQELKTTQEMQEMLQKHYESLKHQHDVASEQLKKLEDERKQLSRTLKDKEAKLSETSKSLQSLSEKHARVVKEREELEQEKETLEAVVDKLRSNISQLELANGELTRKVKSLERLTQEQEESLRDQQEKVALLEAEVNKHEQIASLIQQLSSGKTLPK